MISIKQLGLATAIMLAPFASGAEEDDFNELGDVLFRYTNAQGSYVVEQSIPPAAAAEGYDIITRNGRVLKTVPAAPKGEDAVKYAEKLRREAAEAEWDAHLKRRFSSVKDIQSAKKRALTELQGNLSILRANRGGITAQLEDQQRRAGVMERNGQPVSETILQNIQSLESEARELEKQIEARNQELDKKAAKYDRDIERFKEINS